MMMMMMMISFSIIPSFNARKLGELAIKSIYDDRKGVSVQFPRMSTFTPSCLIIFRELSEAFHEVHVAAFRSECEGGEAGKGNSQEVLEETCGEEAIRGGGEELAAHPHVHDRDGCSGRVNEMQLLCLLMFVLIIQPRNAKSTSFSIDWGSFEI